MSGGGRFGALIIGDEILRGKREDGHFRQLVKLLAARGLSLAWARFIGDDRSLLTQTLRETFGSDDVVFSFGGIGVTPDDHTRQAAALAANVPLVLHPDAEREIRARMSETGQPVTPARLELGAFPQGAAIIPNPHNRIPGFTLNHHHFLPGFPQMAWPMAEWVLDTRYRSRFNACPDQEAALIVWQGQESVLLPLMQAVERDFPGLTVFSLPSLGAPGKPPHIELGVRGPASAIEPAMSQIRTEVARLGFNFELLESAPPNGTGV